MFLLIISLTHLLPPISSICIPNILFIPTPSPIATALSYRALTTFLITHDPDVLPQTDRLVFQLPKLSYLSYFKYHLERVPARFFPHPAPIYRAVRLHNFVSRIVRYTSICIFSHFLRLPRPRLYSLYQLDTWLWKLFLVWFLRPSSHSVFIAQDQHE